MSGAYDFNPDPTWAERIIPKYEEAIAQITRKSTTDEMLRADCAQEARIALATVRPESVKGYTDVNTTPEERELLLDRYLRNVIRNSMLSYLDSYKTGDWYSGRTRHVKQNGAKIKERRGARYAPLSGILDKDIDVDRNGNVMRLRGDGVEVSNTDVPLGISDVVPDDPETEELERLHADTILDRLAPRERAIIEGMLDGFTPDELGVDRPALFALLLEVAGRNGVDLSTVSIRATHKLRLPVSTVADVLARRAAGETTYTLAKEYGLHFASVTRLCAKFGGMAPSPRDTALPHGTTRGYWRGCRCAQCNAARAAQDRRSYRLRTLRTRAQAALNRHLAA